MISSEHFTSVEKAGAPTEAGLYICLLRSSLNYAIDYSLATYSPKFSPENFQLIGMTETNLEVLGWFRIEDPYIVAAQLNKGK